MKKNKKEYTEKWIDLFNERCHYCGNTNISKWYCRSSRIGIKVVRGTHPQSQPYSTLALPSGQSHTPATLSAQYPHPQLYSGLAQFQVGPGGQSHTFATQGDSIKASNNQRCAKNKFFFVCLTVK